ncbi:hypothetical protein BH11GEM2_BH11GEM2_31560 [soil metagenome]
MSFRATAKLDDVRILAKAGIHFWEWFNMDSRFRGNDEFRAWFNTDSRFRGNDEFRMHTG